jgi:hypothetical protein
MAMAIVLAVIILFVGSAMVAGLFEAVDRIKASDAAPKGSLHQTLFDLTPSARPVAFQKAVFSAETCREVSDVRFHHMDAASTAYWIVHCANNNRTYQVEIAADNRTNAVNCAEHTCF